MSSSSENSIENKKGKKHNDKRRNSVAKLEVFPEDFDDVYFHNELVDCNKNIPILRKIVYKKIKEGISLRIKSYGNNVPLKDSFGIFFENNEFLDFEWAVIREELLHCGIESTAKFEDSVFKGISVIIEREISLTTTLKELQEKTSDEYEEDEDEDEDE